MKVAVIPARGGSKRIPRKNIRDFCGKPMIAWSITAAAASRCFDHILVSTDDDEIAAVAETWGAEVPFRRPAALADDYTGTIPVIGHATQWAMEHWGTCEAVCCLYATAPFVRPDDLREGLSRLQETGADYVFSVTHYPFPIQRAVRITRENRVEMFDPSQFNTRSQDLEESFHDAGQFYWGRPRAWLEGHALFSAGASPLVLPRHQVQDIDTPEDWERAERMFKALKA